MLNLESLPDRQVQVFGKNNLLTPHTYETYFGQKWPKFFKFLEIRNFKTVDHLKVRKTAYFTKM